MHNLSQRDTNIRIGNNLNLSNFLIGSAKKGLSIGDSNYQRNFKKFQGKTNKKSQLLQAKSRIRCRDTFSLR